MTLKMTTAQVVETSVTVTNSSFQNYTHPDDHTTQKYILSFLVPLCLLSQYSTPRNAASYFDFQLSAIFNWFSKKYNFAFLSLAFCFPYFIASCLISYLTRSHRTRSPVISLYSASHNEYFWLKLMYFESSVNLS